LQPERIKPDHDNPGYNVKSDVWSLGITMVFIYIVLVVFYPQAESRFKSLLATLCYIIFVVRNYLQCCWSYGWRSRHSL